MSRAHLLRGSVSACARQSCVRDHSPSVPCSRFDASSVTTRVYVFLGRPKYPRKHVESRRMPRDSPTQHQRCRKLVIHFLVSCSRIAYCVSSHENTKRSNRALVLPQGDVISAPVLKTATSNEQATAATATCVATSSDATVRSHAGPPRRRQHLTGG